MIDWNIDERTTAHLDPSDAQLKPFIQSIVEGSFSQDHIFCQNRNTVILSHFGGKQYVVKRFKRPTIANCFVYTCLRKTKCERAYLNAQTLLGLGVSTPRPVAWITQTRHGFFHTGWFVSEYMPRPSLLTLWPSLTPEQQEVVVDDLAVFIANLFSNRILLGDYNLGNLLPQLESDGHYTFALVDINRMRMGSVSTKREMKSIQTLSLDLERMARFIDRYAEIRCLDPYKCCIWLSINHLTFERHRRMKHLLKTSLGIEQKRPCEVKV